MSDIISKLNFFFKKKNIIIYINFLKIITTYNIKITYFIQTNIYNYEKVFKYIF